MKISKRKKENVPVRSSLRIWKKVKNAKRIYQGGSKTRSFKKNIRVAKLSNKSKVIEEFDPVAIKQLIS